VGHKDIFYTCKHVKCTVGISCFLVMNKTHKYSNKIMFKSFNIFYTQRP
jgi:hypothetical protein